MKKIIICILIIMDELIKAIIYFNFMKIDFRIINDKFGFSPYLNTDQLSIFNNELNMSLSLGVLMLINILSILVMFFLYQFLLKKMYVDNFLIYSMLIITSGCICSLIDKIIYKGCLDYILVFNKICDLKDIYLLTGIVLLCIYLFRYSRKDALNSR